MNPHLLPATAPVDVPAWQQTVLAFLADEAQARARRAAATHPGADRGLPALTAIPVGGLGP